MPVPAVIALDGVIRHYAWGSRAAIPELVILPAALQSLGKTS